MELLFVLAALSLLHDTHHVYLVVGQLSAVAEKACHT